MDKKLSREKTETMTNILKMAGMNATQYNNQTKKS